MTDTVPESSDCYAQINYFDVDQTPLIPDQVFWRLYDDTNGRQVVDWTAIPAPLGLSNQVSITGVMNTMVNQKSALQRMRVTFRVVASGGANRYSDKVYFIEQKRNAP